MHRLPAKRRSVGEGSPGGYQEYDQTKVIEIGKSRMETRQEEKEEGRAVTRLHHGLQKQEIREQVGPQQLVALKEKGRDPQSTPTLDEGYWKLEVQKSTR